MLILSLLLLTRKFVDSNLARDRLSWHEFFLWLPSVVLRAWRNNRITSNRITTASLHILPNSLFGAFAELRKATMSFVMSVCLSVRPPARPHGTTRLPLDEFSWNLMFKYFLKSISKIQVSLKSGKNSGYVTWRPTNIFDHIPLSSSYRGAVKSWARPTSRCILFDGENISFDASLVIYINSTNITPIMIINRIYENQNLLSL